MRLTTLILPAALVLLGLLGSLVAAAVRTAPRPIPVRVAVPSRAPRRPER